MLGRLMIRVFLEITVLERDVDACAWKYHWSFVRVQKASKRLPRVVMWLDSSLEIEILAVFDTKLGVYLEFGGEQKNLILKDVIAFFLEQVRVVEHL
jgi:hypothetical protein